MGTTAFRRGGNVVVGWRRCLGRSRRRVVGAGAAVAAGGAAVPAGGAWRWLASAASPARDPPWGTLSCCPGTISEFSLSPFADKQIGQPDVELREIPNSVSPWTIVYRSPVVGTGDVGIVGGAAASAAPSGPASAAPSGPASAVAGSSVAATSSVPSSARTPSWSAPSTSSVVLLDRPDRYLGGLS